MFSLTFCYVFLKKWRFTRSPEPSHSATDPSFSGPDFSTFAMLFFWCFFEGLWEPFYRKMADFDAKMGWKSEAEWRPGAIKNLTFFQNVKNSFSHQFLQYFSHVDHPQKASSLKPWGDQKWMKKRSLKNASTKSIKNATWSDFLSKSDPKWFQKGCHKSGHFRV